MEGEAAGGERKMQKIAANLFYGRHRLDGWIRRRAKIATCASRKGIDSDVYVV